METLTKGVNIAPTSDHGHFVESARKVVNLDDITEAYFVEGASELTTANHKTLQMQEDCLINCQVVYDPFAKMYQRSKD